MFQERLSVIKKRGRDKGGTADDQFGFHSSDGRHLCSPKRKSSKPMLVVDTESTMSGKLHILTSFLYVGEAPKQWFSADSKKWPQSSKCHERKLTMGSTSTALRKKLRFLVMRPDPYIGQRVAHNASLKACKRQQNVHPS